MSCELCHSIYSKGYREGWKEAWIRSQKDLLAKIDKLKKDDNSVNELMRCNELSESCSDMLLNSLIDNGKTKAEAYSIIFDLVREVRNQIVEDLKKNLVINDGKIKLVV